MPIESVSQRLNAANLDRMTEAQLRALLGNLVDAMQAICAKLDADAGVTDTNYNATLATFIID
jgi:hypothetical protein